MTEKWILFVIIFVVATASLVIGVFQFLQKGALLNNAYLHATAEERENTDYRPYYMQSGIVFCAIALIFYLNAAEVFLNSGVLFYAAIILALILILYAIISSVLLRKK